MPRGKKRMPPPSAALFGEDPVSDEDENEDNEPSTPVEEKSKRVIPVASLSVASPSPPPAPLWDAPVTTHEVDRPYLNKPCMLFSHAQYQALLAYLVESRAGLSDEKRHAFDAGHLGQILKNLRGI